MPVINANKITLRLEKNIKSPWFRARKIQQIVAINSSLCGRGRVAREVFFDAGPQSWVKSRGRVARDHTIPTSPQVMVHRNLPASPLRFYTGSNLRVTGPLYSTLPAVGVGLRQTDVGQNAVGEFAGHGI